MQHDDQPIETSEAEARPYQPAQPCCADPRPDCMGMLVEGIGNRCRAMESPPSGQSAGPAGAPDRIFLVISEDIPRDTPFSQLAEVTWCPDRVNDTDIEYVRAQPAAATVPTTEFSDAQPLYLHPPHQPKRTVTYVCPVCAASLERQE